MYKFTAGELKELDQVIKRELRAHTIQGRQTVDERLHSKREDGGHGIKSMRDVYQETRLRVASYMAYSKNMWIKAAWMRETRKEENAIMPEAMKIMEDIGKILELHSCSRKVADGSRCQSVRGLLCENEIYNK